MRFFNTAGPVDPRKHYCLPPLERLALDEVLALIQQEKYFVLHAPRQTGKTSTLLALLDYLNGSGRYRCVYVNVEVGQAAREDVAAAMAAILVELGTAARIQLGDDTVDRLWQEALRHSPYTALGDVLTRWAECASHPLIVLIDEIDALIGDTLIAVLRQLRTGYTRRPQNGNRQRKSGQRKSGGSGNRGQTTFYSRKSGTDHVLFLERPTPAPGHN